MPNNLIHCLNPLCNDDGWYPDYDHNGEAEQVQCEFCYTNPNSYFNALQQMRAGDKCLNCGGSGFMVKIDNRKVSCVYCNGTGIYA